MKITLEEIEQVLNELMKGITYAKEARRIAKKVYGDQKTITANLHYTYEHLQRAVKILEMD
jgi:hypothetical protein